MRPHLQDFFIYLEFYLFIVRKKEKPDLSFVCLFVNSLFASTFSHSFICLILNWGKQNWKSFPLPSRIVSLAAVCVEGRCVTTLQTTAGKTTSRTTVMAVIFYSPVKLLLRPTF